jgi:hypothetical protein
MQTPTARFHVPALLPGLLVLSAVPLAAQQPPAAEVPAPGAPPTTQVAPQGPRERKGEVLDPSAIGPGVIESMAEVLARQEAMGPDGPNPKARNGAQGEWEVPGMRWNQSARSGSKHLINRWGDTRIGIGFGQEVDLEGAWLAGQGTTGSWTSGVMAIGYRDGSEVARSAWFETIGAQPAWFAIGLEDVDRVEIVARPVVEGAGWYALDDLTFRVEAEAGAALRVLDFEDVPYGTRLTGTGYAGLDWERGTGEFVQPAQEVPPPQVPPGTEVEREVPSESTKLGGSGTSPILLGEFAGPVFGDVGANLIPPDTCGAVGSTHFVAATNSNLSVYVKATGQRVMNVSLNSFWATSGLGDPRVVWDGASNRFVAIASSFSSTARVYFAYSLTSDPTGAWFKTFISVAQGTDAGKWPDYPTLGVDPNGVYIAAYMVGGANLMSIFSVDKAPLLSGTPAMGTVTAWRLLPWEGAIQPCVTFGNSGGVFLVSRQSSTLMRVRQITGPLTGPTLVEKGAASVPSNSSAPNATQKGTSATLDTIDSRPMNAVWRNGSLWTTHCISIGGRAGVRWYEIATATTTLVQSGSVSDPSLHYYMPGISVNAAGEMLLGFSGSDANHFASAYMTGRVPSDPPGETGAPVLYFAGLAPYTQISSSGSNRWGDYSLTSVDPVNDDTFWTIQEYARSNNTWGTRIARGEFGCAAPGNYCTGKITSNFCGPTMSAAGQASLSLPAFFSVSCTQMDPNVTGLIFFGTSGPASTPFQGAFLCVNPPTTRLPGKSTAGAGACAGSLTYTLSDFLATPAGPSIVVGSQVHCQAWARDTADPFGTSLSDGLRFDVCP